MKRKILLKEIAPFAILIILTAAVIIAQKLEEKTSGDCTLGISFFAMDTFVSIRSQSDALDIGDIEEIFRRYEAALDCNDDKYEAEASRLNRYAEIDGSDILLETIHSVLDLNVLYGTLTDITVGRLTKLWNVTAEDPVIPKESDIKSALKTIGTENISVNGSRVTLKNNTVLDFGAVGKGAALDACYEYLKKNNSKKTIVSTGSSILFYGGDSFDVDIADPEGNGSFASVKTGGTFLSTSGGYERFFEADGKTYCHIIDPRTGYPTETDLTTVTVFCGSGIESDFLSTMIFLDGSENIEKYLNSPNYKIFAADKNKNLYVSEGIDYELTNGEYKPQKADN